MFISFPGNERLISFLISYCFPLFYPCRFTVYLYISEVIIQVRCLWFLIYFFIIISWARDDEDYWKVQKSLNYYSLCPKLLLWLSACTFRCMKKIASHILFQSFFFWIKISFLNFYLKKKMKIIFGAMFSICLKTCAKSKSVYYFGTEGVVKLLTSEILLN